MSIWPKSTELEGRGEIYLRWKNLAIIASMILLPLVLALFFNSFVIKGIFWLFSFIAYTSTLRVQGPCITAIAVGALPWYIYFEWEYLPVWSAIIAFIISSVEISYVQHRMRFISEMREKDGTLV